MIDRWGALLVFPDRNRPEPPSLWSLLHPRKKLRWEWSEDGDDEVVKMWNLMKRLSEDRRVVYSKWFRGRATFFSRPVFAALLLMSQRRKAPLGATARRILETLESDSPLSTKQLKALTELRGRDFEPEYNRAMKQLFQEFLIVGCGEVEDGAFPSLAVGATRLIYEDLWLEAERLSSDEARSLVEKHFPAESSFGTFLARSWQIGHRD